ncbi:microcin C ABC transporter permease YejB [Amphritea sp. 1_MG-2023]|uniref:microcin C ABC transporter permease YejB n=1 Tax=Amphritea sp. 1_MG-2023 TaxID=3062670 RepID=UPI0026E33019|nr:microcin C ABC transporter permease YejB [Amphritea sp. 1_MG-2023]MDO6562521.1 microcin C ABC transporter permease YejB [Amphritea sp. 1_MG-2023]
MAAYILRRLLLIIPTLLGILSINFLIIQAAPGGPVEQTIANLQGLNASATARFDGSAQSDLSGASQAATENNSSYRGGRGLDPQLVKQIEAQFGFDKPAHERFLQMLKNYLVFDFGESLFSGKKVTDLIIEKLPVSISLGLWTTLITYLVAVPLGIKKAVRDGTAFDVWSSSIIIIGYAIPNFLFAILLIVLFAGGTYFSWFPLRGLTSADFDQLSTWGQIKDYFWHITLPVLVSVIGSFATLSMLTKNSFLDEINKQYVITARAKGLSENQVLYGHVFRNAMLLIIAGMPAALIGIFFTGSMLIEVIFSLDGIGLLGYEAVIKRDYPVIFGTLYIFTLIGLLLKLVSDLTYVAVDPRIDFESREN